MSDLTPEQLGQIEKAVQKEFGDHMEVARQSGVDYETMPPGVRIERDAFLLIAEVKRQRAVIERVRELHRRGDVFGREACIECENYDYPCDTIKALGGEA